MGSVKESFDEETIIKNHNVFEFERAFFCSKAAPSLTYQRDNPSTAQE